MHHLSSGSLLQGGRYEIKRFIAAGGFGCTYEGVHTGLDKRVAIKEFFVKDFCNRDETTSQITVGVTAKTALFQKLRRKFEEEARALAKLNHPNIVKVSDVFDENGTSYYVMDYIDGPSLKNIVDTKGPLSETDAVRYILQVADALEFVHKNKRLHLDVKPGNIMINAEGKAQLIDFGASKQYEEESGENTATINGFTVGYAPTEQMGNDVNTFTPATDIYSLGATLYNILTGIKPISAATISSGEKQKPLPEYISTVTRNAIAEAMQINKNHRPQTMEEFVDLLKDDPTIYPEPKPEPDPKPKPKKKEKSSKKPVVMVVGLLFLCVIGYFVIPKSNIPEQQPITDSIAEPVVKVEHVTGQTFKDAGGQEYTYTGEVLDGKPNGKGTGIYPYGTYTGEYKNSLRHGKGSFETIVTKDGSNKYEGTFVDDMYDKGKMSFSDGRTFEGTFKDGQPFNGNMYNKNRSITWKVVNGYEE